MDYPVLKSENRLIVLEEPQPDLAEAYFSVA